MWHSPVVVVTAELTEGSCSLVLLAPAGTMWIQVRTMDGKVAHTVDSLSRLTKVEELRKKIQELFHVEPGLQRLFYRGKQVNPPCRLPARLPACPPSTFVLASIQAPHTHSSPLVRSASPQKPPMSERGTKALDS